MHETDNEDRRAWARKALDAFGAETGQINYAYDDAECLGEIAGDLIANLLHLADAAGLDADELIERARLHYDVERDDDDDDDDDDDEPVWPQHKNDIGDWCPWSDVSKQADDNRCPAGCRASDPDDEKTVWDRSQGPKPYDHDARPDDNPEPGDRCKDCGDDVTWQGPGPYDWLHVEAQDWRS